MTRASSSLAAQLALLKEVAPADDDIYDDFHRPKPSASTSSKAKPHQLDDAQDEDTEEDDGQKQDSDLEDEESDEDDEGDQQSDGLEDESEQDEDEDEDDQHDEEQDDDDAQLQEPSANPLASQAAESELLLQSLQSEQAALAARGRAIKRQQREWDSILELRIRAQKVIRTGMRIQAAAVKPLLSHQDTSEQTRSQHTATLRQLDALSASLFVLRAKLLRRAYDSGSEGPSLPQNLSLDNLEEERERANKRIKLDPSAAQDDDTDDDDEARQTRMIQNLLTLDTKTFNPSAYSILNSTHNKFNAGAAAGGQGGANKFKNAASQTPAEQIEASLSNAESKRRLLERTQVWKGDEDRIRVSDAVAANGDSAARRGADRRDDLPELTARAADPDIFDDADLYSHLLRELIEAKTGRAQSASAATAASSQSEINADLTLLAPSTLFGKNKKPSKRNVDTRASKGRKIRYEVNEKIANFMPPVPTRLLWDEEQIDRLFTKLNTRLGDQDVVRRTTSTRDDAVVGDDVENVAGEGAGTTASNPVIDGLQLFG
ncbi:rRNA-processing protein bfr2 [Tilletia horrida]|nr:rRNA-processing protein bfr2 [Tilletia horrida]